MQRYVAFLRGMNLGGRRIKNEELRRHFEEMGLEKVATFRASGNVIFSDLDLKAIEKLLGADTRRTMGTIEQIALKLS